MTIVCAQCKEPWRAYGSPARCPNCGEASFAIAIAVSAESRELSPEQRTKLSAARKKMWQDPGYRAKMGVAMKKVWQDPEYQTKMKATRKKRWEDPEYRAKISETREKNQQHI